MLCIAGKNDIATDVASYVLQAHPAIELVGITTKNDTGIDNWQKSYKKFLHDNKIPEVQVQDVCGIEDLVFLSLEFDQIINPNHFRSGKLYNLHFSLLPKYRGMYTSAVPILNNEKETGVTLHYIDSGIDTGDIIAQEKVEISFDDTAGDLYLKLIDSGIALVKKYIATLLNEGRVISQKQNPLEASYYAKSFIDYPNLKIDFNQCAISIYNQLRAFHFRSYQLPRLNGMDIFKSDITETRSSARPGTILEVNRDYLKIATVDFDMVLYRDRYDELMEALQKKDIVAIAEFKTYKKYWTERNKEGETPLKRANSLELAEMIKEFIMKNRI